MNDKKKIKKMKVGVVYGGPSSERDVSIRSAENVQKALKRKGYNAVMIDLDNNISEKLRKEDIELVYIILHGSPGEDGTIQGLLDIMKIPYTGSGVLGSAISMNKIVTKQLFQANDILTPSFVIIDDEYKISDIEKLKFPIIFKPYAEGSSIGIKKYDTINEFNDSIGDMIKKYSYGIAEEFLTGMEITVGVLDENEKTIALPILELISENEFYDYDAKYTKGKTRFIIPARLDKRLTRQAQELAIRAFKTLWCRGVSRVDMIFANKDIYVLEVNTIPGMTDTSDLPAEAREMGIEFDDLVEKILIAGISVK
ncbi:MAG: D-alanine--D-alanine ligase [Spirochaetes bacterium]|nr:D-alanine--D-alanine ligase [Spirochaetota bacterium]